MLDSSVEMSLHAHLAAPDPKLGPLLAQLGPPAPPTDDSLVLRRQFEAASFLHQAEWEDRLPPGESNAYGGRGIDGGISALDYFGLLTRAVLWIPQRPGIV